MTGHYAFPGLMTRRPVNAMRNIIADEDGSLLLLLHAGKVGDRVHYALVMGGNRTEGVVKDPSYPYLDGLGGHERTHYAAGERPQFSYITEVLPDNVYVPFVRVGDCPVPITELFTEPCRPAYFILKLPDTGLPVGDTIVEVSINGRRRNYIVQRPDFAVHRKHGRDLTAKYRKLTAQPDGMFELQTDNGRSCKADIHLLTRSIPDGARYLVYMANGEYSITLDYVWKGRELIVVKLPQGLPTGRYKCVASYTMDNETWTEITQGHVTVTERKQDEMDVTVQPDEPYTLDIDLAPYNVPTETVPAVAAEWILETGDPAHEGRLYDNYGHAIAIGPYPGRPVQELVDDINRSTISLIARATLVDEGHIKLVANDTGAAGNSVVFTATYYTDERTEDPCFGSGPATRIVDGRDGVRGATFRAIGYAEDGLGRDLPCEVADGKLRVTIQPQDDGTYPAEWTCYFSTMEGSWVPMTGGAITVSDEPAYSSIRREGTHLYNLEYTSLDREYAMKFLMRDTQPVGCTSVRNGNLYGRNLDWSYDDSVCFVVRTGTDVARHAVLGVTGAVIGLDMQTVSSGMYSSAYKAVPYAIVDGINDKGLVVSSHVVPAGDKGDNSVVEPTGMVRDDICARMLPRVLLESFENAEWACRWVRSHMRLRNPSALVDKGYELHFMVADANSTWAIEFVDGVTQVTNLTAAGREVMTNFHIHGTEFRDGDTPMVTPAEHEIDSSAIPSVVNKVTPHAAGLERYNLAYASAGSATDAVSMMGVMKSLAYTRTYQSSEHPASPRWDTEFTGIANLTVDSTTHEFDAVQEAAAVAYMEAVRDGETWHTSHTSVYEMNKRSLHLCVQEDYHTEFTYSI